MMSCTVGGMITHGQWDTRSGESYKPAARSGELKPVQSDLSDMSTKRNGKRLGPMLGLCKADRGAGRSQPEAEGGAQSITIVVTGS